MRKNSGIFGVTVKAQGLVAGLVVGTVALAAFAGGVREEDWEHEAIRYRQSQATDAVTALQKQITLEFNAKNGYLTSVLKNLKVEPSSQILVFSKTSFQRDLISADTPRALYFNDHTFVGWVQNGDLLEISATDPNLGTVFYTLSQTKTGKPKFVRQNDECLQCHATSMSKDVPGVMMRSMFTRIDGQPEFSAGSTLTTDQSPFEERWGGWYVTGTHGAMRHMGNVVAKGGRDNVTLDKEAGANITQLRRFFSTAPYLTPHSDIVALMVAEHQTQVQNLITKANYLTRIALHYDKSLNEDPQRPAGYRSDSATRRMGSICEPLVKALLFCEEAPLSDAVKGTSGFAERFAASGVKDAQGRSLRQFDLTRRLFRYPCSYLVYSEAFLKLPEMTKQTVYRRLREVLTAQEAGKEFAHLTASDRKAILEILTETHAEFARSASAPSAVAKS
jgi:hypothetical protein